MIRVLLEMELVYPYSQSLSVLADFCVLYHSAILLAGTHKKLCKISMPLNHFKNIFHVNPIEKEYEVPSGMENFIESVVVKKVIAK